MKKIFLLARSYWAMDDGIAGIFSTREKAVAYFKEHRSEFFGTDGKAADDFIDEYEVDPE